MEELDVEARSSELLDIDELITVKVTLVDKLEVLDTLKPE